MKQSRILSVLANFRAVHRFSNRFEWWRRGRGRCFQKRRDGALPANQLPPHPAIAAARDHLRRGALLRIDPDERLVDVEAAGVWVRAWIWVDRAAIESHEARRRVRFRDAVEALAEPARSVFLAHSVEDLSYELIAERHGLDVEVVQIALAEALTVLSAAIDEE